MSVPDGYSTYRDKVRLTLYNVQIRPVLALGILVSLQCRITLDAYKSSITNNNNKSASRSSFVTTPLQKATTVSASEVQNSPFGQALDKVPLPPLRREGRDAEEASPLVAGLVPRTAVARYAVAQDLAARAGGVDLRVVGEVANDGYPGQGAGGRLAEGAAKAGLGCDAGDCWSDHFRVCKGYDLEGGVIRSMLTVVAVRDEVILDPEAAARLRRAWTRLGFGGLCSPPYPRGSGGRYVIES